MAILIFYSTAIQCFNTIWKTNPVFNLFICFCFLYLCTTPQGSTGYS